MNIQFQIVFDEFKTFKLVARTYTTNELELVHQQTVDLDDNLERAFAKLMYPTFMEFKEVETIATAESIEKVKAEQEQKNE